MSERTNSDLTLQTSGVIPVSPPKGAHTVRHWRLVRAARTLERSADKVEVAQILFQAVLFRLALFFLYMSANESDFCHSPNSSAGFGAGFDFSPCSRDSGQKGKGKYIRDAPAPA